MKTQNNQAKRRILTTPANVNSLFKNYEKRIALKMLEQYASEIDFVLGPYNRKSAEETMMVKGLRKSNQKTTTRKTHSENLASIAHLIAEGLNKKNRVFKFNYGILDIMAKNHDIGHTFLGHSGEWWLSNIKEDYGIGYYVHNALGPRELIYTDDIYNKIIETIKQRHPKTSTKTLNRIKKSLWIIMEGINSHNGERSEREYKPDLTKTEKDFKIENLLCHTKKGFDKTVLPATPEAALMRICDKISYIPYDMVDGIREGFISGLNEEYRVVLRQLGITDKEIDTCSTTNNYEGIARSLQIVFINDVIANSTGTSIRMSENISKLLHELRNINNRQIVDFVVLKEDNETYPPSLRTLMSEFKDIVLREHILDDLENGEISVERKKQLIELYKGTPFLAGIEYILNTNPNDYKYTKKLIKLATKQSILDEQAKARDIVRKGEPFIPSKDFELRDGRISAYIGYYTNMAKKGNVDFEHYPEESQLKDLNAVLTNISSPTKSSPFYYKMSERIALEMGAKYLATLNDIEFIDLLRLRGLVNDEQYASLTRKYKDIPDLHSEVYIQPNWKKIASAQAAQH